MNTFIVNSDDASAVADVHVDSTHAVLHVRNVRLVVDT